MQIKSSSIAPLTCVLIGQDNLLIECANLVRSKSFVIIGIISPSDQIKNWAQPQEIPWSPSLSAIDWHIQSADYLFSVVNNDIIPTTLLDKIRRLAINYHDGPLPRYAGSNATSWAILNGESQHAVTWHVINQRIDAGDILKQRNVSLELDETALSLNLKCVEHAIASFAELLDELGDGSYQRSPQDLAQRTYFARSKKPANNGLINWHSRADEIDRLCRATQFGQYRNPFSVAKILVGDAAYAIEALTVLPECSDKSPGTLLEVGRDYWKIATLTNDIKLSALAGLRGESIQLDALTDRHNLTVAARLPLPGDSDVDLLHGLSAKNFATESYWVQTLRSFQPTAVTFQQAKCDLSQIPQSVYDRVLEFTKDKTDAPFVILTAWLIYLGRIESQTQLNIYLRRKDTTVPESLCAFFAQYLPFSVTIDDQSNFRQVLHHVKQAYQDLSQHGSYLNDCWRRYPELANHSRDEGFYVTIGAVTQTPDEEHCVLHKPFFTLLNELLVHAQQPINQAAWVTPAERQTLLIDWNTTDTPYPYHKTVHGLFEEQAQNTPDHIALIAPGVRLTYQELNLRANQLAHYLLSHYAIQPDQLVAVFLERSEWMLIALLGILKSGAGYVPIDPGYPDNRIRFIANETKARAIITTHDLQERLAKLSVENSEVISTVVLNDADFSVTLKKQRAESPLTAVHSRNLAYVIYTSGTTGTPKGIQIEHRSIVNRVIWMNRTYPLSQTDRVLQKTPYVFDVSVWELFWANWTGAAVVFAKPDGHRNLHYLARLIHDEEISIVHFTPTMLNGFVQATESDATGSDFRTLRHLFCSGEALHDATVDKARSRMPHVRIHNLYGPTEAAIDVLYDECVANRPVCLGKPISNTHVYVLDDQNRLLPPGMPGELYLAGDGLARGYLNQSALTSQQFVSNPFQTAQEKHEKRFDLLYKTGDLVRWLPSGDLDYIGRLDRQIKLRGYRIELGEIEQVIQRHPAIAQCAVIVRDNQLIAYYTARQATNEAAIQLYVASWLPNYMTPNHWVCLNTMPTGISGKVDYKQLPSPVDTKSRQFIPPRNTIEITMAMVFSAVLGIEKSTISITDDFFHLGGDSILAIRLVGRINELLNQNIQVRQVFELKTIQALSALLERAEPTAMQPESSYQPFSLVELSRYQELLSQHDIEDIYPASRLQIGMLLESSLNDNGTYHDVFFYEIDRPFVEEKFLKIWEALANKHALLRARFFLSEQHALDVVILKRVQLHYRLHVNQSLHKLIDDERLIQFAHTEECLFHLIVNQHTDNFELIFSFHHALVDGWSVASLINEFVQAYAFDQPVMQATNEPSSLTYGEFVRNELCRLGDHDSIAFWKKYLNGSKPAHASWKFDDLEKSPDSLFTNAFHLTPDEAKQTRQLARYNAVSVDTVFLVAYLKALSFFMNSDDITIGILFNNRLEKVGGDTLFGSFLNVLPFRYKPNQKQSLQNELRATFSNKIKLLAHKHIPYAQLKSIFGYSLYEFGFNFNHFHILDQSDSVITSRGGFDRSSVPFVLEVTQTDTFKIELKSHDDYVSQKYLNYFGNYLKLAIQNISHGKNALRLDIKDYQKLIIDWNATDRSFPQETTLHRLFEEQVERTPDAIALVFEDKQYTYEALNQHANQLAHYLRQRYQIEKEELIALCQDRNELAVIAILAVLKSGAAYVPIEPGNPDDRIFSIFRECRPRVILSNVLYRLRLERFTQSELCETLFLDDALNTKEIQKYPCTNPDVRMDGCHLAYVLYTSGTTGTPVGVMIEHRGVVNLVFEMIRRDNLCQNKRIAVYFSFAFDASVHELFPALLSGCQTFLLSNHVRYDLHSLCDFFQRHAIQNSAIPTGLISEFIQTCQPGELECIYTGADKLKLNPDVDPEKLPYSLINEYGPTEATVCTTFKRVSKEATGQIRTNNIGTSLPNVHCYVVDTDMQPVPVGVIGELGISGVNLARGYLNNPTLTAQKFIPNPFQTNQEKNQGIHAVLYKTGDLVRWLPNGDLEFIARNDKQTKIRGNRVDLGEVENVMMTFPKIKQCAVVAIPGQGDSPNSKPHTSLAAYYVKNDQVMNDDESDFVDQWKSLKEFEYSQSGEQYQDIFHGWNSSYTDEPIPRDEMLEWQTETLVRIKKLNPRRILEIGCGSGLMLFGLLEQCQHYYATDISENAIRSTQQRTNQLSVQSKVQFIACAGNMIPYSQIGVVDTAILNSVIQHFPNLDYLEKLLIQIIHHIGVGCIFIGDVRDFRLLDCFHHSVLKNKKTSSCILDNVLYLASREKELLISPEYFVALKKRLPQISSVRLFPKSGKARNEMNCYRYDVVLHIGDTGEKLKKIPAEEFIPVSDLQIFTEQHQQNYLAIRYPNALIVDDYLSYQSLRGQHCELSRKDIDNLYSQEQIQKMFDQYGYQVVFNMNIPDPLYMNIIAYKKSELLEPQIEYDQSCSHATNISSNPLLNFRLSEDRFNDELVSHLQKRLPNYMIPSHFIPLVRLPLHANGKLNRNVLPKPIQNFDCTNFPPTNQTEVVVRDIFAQVLGMAAGRIGIKDDFFSLGGDSLLIFRLLLKINQYFGCQIQPADFFANRSVGKLARCLAEVLRSSKVSNNV